MNIRQAVRESATACHHADTVDTFFHVLDAYLNEITSSQVGSILTTWMEDKKFTIVCVANMLEFDLKTYAFGVRLNGIITAFDDFNSTEDFHKANEALASLNIDLAAEGFSEGYDRREPEMD